MAINAYSPCPAGTGKKIKFCCPDLQSELEKIDRMIEGEQFVASLQHVDQLEAKGQRRACLMAIKAELLRATNQFEAAETYAAEFVERFSENPVAWSESALLTAMRDGGAAAMGKLQKAFALCQGAIHHRVYEAAEVVANELLEEGSVVAGRALLSLLNALNPNDRHVTERLIYFNRAANVPLLLKADPGLMTCPADVPWREKFEAAMEPMKRAQWQETADRLAALADEVPAAPVVWNNLGRIRSWLGDDGAGEALRRYAALDVPLDDAVEAEATALLLSPSSLGDEVDVLRWSWNVRDPERLQELLLSDRRVLTLPADLSAWPVDESPPPRMVAAILDRPALRSEDPLSRETVPSIECQLLLFGRETDRAARLEVDSLTRPTGERVAAVLREIGGDTLEAAPEETVIGKLSASREIVGHRFVPPPGAPRERIEALLKDEFRDAILHRWPDMPLGTLGGRSLRQAAEAAVGDHAAQVNCLAVVLVAQQIFVSVPGEFDFNDLRAQLGLPVLGPIDPRHCDLPRLPLVRLARIETDALDDQPLKLVFHRAWMYHAWEAARKFAQAIVARSSFASSPERSEAYRALVESATTIAEAVRVLDQARGEALAAGQSCAMWDLMELSFRFGHGDAPAAMQLMQHIESRHINEPGVAQSLTQLLINAGLLNPDGTPVAIAPGMRAAAEPVPAAAEPAKLWTPDSESAGAGGKLWMPGG